MNKEAKIVQHLKNVEACTKLLKWAEKEKQKESPTMTPYKDICPELVAKAYRQIYPEWKRMKAQIEAANKLLDEKIKAWDEAYSLEANDLQWAASVDLEAVKTILFPRNREQGPEMPEANMSLQAETKSKSRDGTSELSGGSLDNPVSPQKEECMIGGLPQNVPACPELKEQTKQKEEATK